MTSTKTGPHIILAPYIQSKETFILKYFMALILCTEDKTANMGIQYKSKKLQDYTR